MKKVTSFVLKIASRCNLNCSYCYMYNMGDQTYLQQPKFMSLKTITMFAKRLKSYSELAGIEYAQIVFHGGEPLLQKPSYFKKVVAIFKRIVPKLDIGFTVQTNGVNLDQKWYDMFNANNISIGISFDGPKKHHDKFRVYHNGKGSYNKVSQAVKLGTNNGLKAVLMVTNIDVSPDDLYAEMKSLGAMRWNLLLPDGHYQHLPDGFDIERFGDDNYTPYADWFIALYKLWKKDTERPSIYFFETLIEMIMGVENVGNQLIGRKTNGVLVIETDGSIEVVDSLRACFEGITRNSINVHSHKIEDLFEDKVFDVYYNAHEKVTEQCLNCPVYDICGGGFFGHRYSVENGFDNPTIYCKDMIRLVNFFRNDVINSFPTETIKQLELETLDYQEIIGELKKPFKKKINRTVKEALTSFKQKAVV